MKFIAAGRYGVYPFENEKKKKMIIKITAVGLLKGFSGGVFMF